MNSIEKGTRELRPILSFGLLMSPVIVLFDPVDGHYNYLCEYVVRELLCFVTLQICKIEGHLSQCDL